MYYIKGFKKNEGEYEGKKWENYTLFCTCPDDPNVTGESVAIFKVKPNILSKYFSDPSKLLGSSVAFSMEQRNYGGKISVAVTDIIILKKGE